MVGMIEYVAFVDVRCDASKHRMNNVCICVLYCKLKLDILNLNSAYIVHSASTNSK